MTIIFFSRPTVIESKWLRKAGKSWEDELRGSVVFSISRIW